MFAYSQDQLEQCLDGLKSVLTVTKDGSTLFAHLQYRLMVCEQSLDMFEQCLDIYKMCTTKEVSDDCLRSSYFSEGDCLATKGIKHGALYWRSSVMMILQAMGTSDGSQRWA